MNPIVKAIIVNRLREPSTYLGLVLVVGGALGYQINDELGAEIAGALAVIVGAILAVHRERKSSDHPANRHAQPPFTDVDSGAPPEPRERPPHGGARERFTHRQRDEHEDGGP
jgi:hypothetical protein